MSASDLVVDDERIVEILDDALDLWGRELQEDTAIEELAELIEAISRRRRGRIDDPKVVDEIADVLLAANHLALIYGREDVLDRLDYKIDRLEDRIDVEQWANGGPEP